MVEPRIAKVVLYEYKYANKTPRGFGGTISYPGSSTSGYVGKDLNAVINVINGALNGKVDIVNLETRISHGIAGSLEIRRITAKDQAHLRRQIGNFDRNLNEEETADLE